MSTAPIGVVMTTNEALDRTARAARNQTLFRQVNERIEALNESFGLVLPIGEWVCECANTECTKLIELTVAEYEAVRGEATHFAVHPSDEHVWPDVEWVIERNDRYWVVEKLGESAEIVERSDPRA